MEVARVAATQVGPRVARPGAAIRVAAAPVVEEVSPVVAATPGAVVDSLVVAVIPVVEEVSPVVAVTLEEEAVELEVAEAVAEAVATTNSQAH